MEQTWAFRFRVVAAEDLRGLPQLELREASRVELERRLAAGAEVPGLKAKVVRLRWALVKERRRRRVAEEEQEGAEARAVAAEERAAEAEERALRWEEEADRERWQAREWARTHLEAARRLRAAAAAAEAEVARLRRVAAAAAAPPAAIIAID